MVATTLAVDAMVDVVVDVVVAVDAVAAVAVAAVVVAAAATTTRRAKPRAHQLQLPRQLHRRLRPLKPSSLPSRARSTADACENCPLAKCPRVAVVTSDTGPAAV